MAPKFRCWFKDTGTQAAHMVEWHELREFKALGDLLKYSGENKLFHLMQSTGLKDKNGVEIFEGDILKCTSGIYTNLGATGTGEYEETIKQVVWKDDSWGTRVISSNLTSKGAEKSGLVISAKYAEVIGNIHENPKLLEQANEN